MMTSVLPSPQSFETNGYRKSSKKKLCKASKSLSPAYNKSINTNQSCESIVSYKNLSMNDIRK
ncbi:unnamed protein product, partial [Rotaria sp. Silwood2]